MNKLNLTSDLPLLLVIVVVMLMTYFLMSKPSVAKFISWALLAVAILLILFGCTHSPVGMPEATKAQAEMDQVRYLDSIYQQLKRIADKMP